MRTLGMVTVAILGWSSVARADDDPPPPPPEPDATTPGPTTMPEPAPTPAPATTNQDDDDDDTPATAPIRPPSTVAPVAVEEPAPPVVRPPGISPFSSMFRQDGSRKIDLDMSTLQLKGDGLTVPDHLVRVDIYGQYVDPATRFGGYASIPTVYAATGELNNTTIGGLELGMIYLPKLESPDFTIVLHAGAVIPTGSTKDMMFADAGVLGRLTEFYASTPDASALRLGVSPVFRSVGGFWLRIDLGIDKSVGSSVITPVDTAYLFGVGVGVDTEHVVFTADITNLVLSTPDENSSSTTATVGTLSARFGAGTIKPYLAFEIPFSDTTSHAMSYGMTVGVTAIP